MMALKIWDGPAETCAELYKMAWLRPTKAALTPLHMNKMIVRRSVGMPSLRAETLSPPIAKIQLPYPVAVFGIVQDEPKQGSSSHPPQDGDLIAAADEVAQKKLGLWAALMATLVVPVSNTDRPSVRPATANNVPKVTINDGTAVRTTKTPLITPTSAPSAKAANMPSQIGPS